MNDCIFCKIVKREIDSDIVHETPNFLVFKDAHPKSNIHLLIVPKTHIEDLRTAPKEIWSEVQDIALVLEKQNELDGFSLVTNTGERALVKHMHVHFVDKINRQEGY
ncbi:MAG TPA: HIT family protein [Patescibacteria group bacterium]